MKNLKQFMLTVCLAQLMIGGACIKGDVSKPPTLPPETQTGENTFGCYINDSLYIPESGNSFGNWGGGCPEKSVYCSKKDSSFGIKTTYQCVETLDIYIIGGGATEFEIELPLKYFYYKKNTVGYDNSPGNCVYKDRTSSQTGKVTITKFDLDKRIVSGTFYGTLKRDGCPDVVIRDGRFDFYINKIYE